MIYVFRRQPSQSAQELAQILTARRVRDPQAYRRRFPLRIRRGDYVVCWGERLAPIDGVRILNGAPLANKFEDACRLAAENVPTIRAVRHAPPQTDNVAPHRARLVQVSGDLARYLHDANFERAVGLFADFQAAYNRMRESQLAPQAAQIWLGRSNYHIGGGDLLRPPVHPDYYVQKEDIIREYRVHSFMAQSIRAGLKVHRTAANGYQGVPHGWIRSHEAGWRLSYGQEGIIRQRHRDLAHRAIVALGLDFGAVDIAEKRDGSLIVLEVNRAPGIEGGTIEKYAIAIQRWIQSGGQNVGRV